MISPDTPVSDPRLPGGQPERDIRPVVERPRAGLSGLAIAGAALIAALILFVALDSRRRAVSIPAARLPRGEIGTSTAPLPLYLPPPAYPANYAETLGPVRAPVPTQAPAVRQAPLSPAPQPLSPPSAVQPAIIPQPRTAPGPALVLDAPTAAASRESERGRPGPVGDVAGASGRAQASMLANRATTVVQGTLIPAVLETAFDSTRPGFARALVQSDVRGFDGTRVLIPRGSRLIGDYAADAAPGQKRAMVAWTRLIRPDGVTIAIGSPAADTVGRGGVRADVNTHFLERFGGAILQSTLDIGVNLASRSSRSPVIVALPGSATGVSGAVRPTYVQPTLRVPAGRSIGVFVARDLDFTEAERVP